MADGTRQVDAPVPVPVAEKAPTTSAAPSTRLTSLDLFRGLTIAGMIVVNDPGTWSHVYGPLLHAEWHGWTPTDLIFPFFLFIVGVSTVFSFSGRADQGQPRHVLAGHVVRRSLIIFGLGLFLNAFPDFNLGELRIPGVLQRIAVCYLIAALLFLYLEWRARVAVTAGLLLGYWALMTLVPVPGYGTGRLDVEGNLAAYIDRVLMMGHLWKPTWDPEGVLSTMPAIGTAMLGLFTGEMLRSNRPPQSKLMQLLLWGVAGLFLGWLWGQWFPINKNLWTSSFVVFTAGFAVVVLGACYWLADIRGWRRWGMPFVAMGMNSIAAYFLSSIFAQTLGAIRVSAGGGQTSLWNAIYTSVYAPIASPKMASLLFALSFTLIFLVITWVMYKRRIFIRI